MEKAIYNKKSIKIQTMLIISIVFLVAAILISLFFAMIEVPACFLPYGLIITIPLGIGIIWGIMGIIKAFIFDIKNEY